MFRTRFSLFSVRDLIDLENKGHSVVYESRDCDVIAMRTSVEKMQKGCVRNNIDVQDWKCVLGCGG